MRFSMEWPFGTEQNLDVERAVHQMRGVFPPELVARVRTRIEALAVGESFDGQEVSPNLPSVWTRTS